MKYILYSVIVLLILIVISYLLTHFVFCKNTADKKRRLFVFASVFLTAYTVSALIYLVPYYKADDKASDYLNNDSSLGFIDNDRYYAFINDISDSAVIFYPGSKVDEYAYSALMRNIALEGYDVYVIKSLFHFPLFNFNGAEEIIDQNNYKRVILAGHSLGGYVASRYANNNTDKIDGLILLGSYPETGIDKDIPFLSIYGDKDGILDLKKYESEKPHWPDNSSEYIIEGANHSGYGYYGLQKGDNQADITADEQIEITSRTIIDFLKS